MPFVTWIPSNPEFFHVTQLVHTFRLCNGLPLQLLREKCTVTGNPFDGLGPQQINFVKKTNTVIKTPAIFIRSLLISGERERGNQIAMRCMNFNSIESCLFCAAGGISKFFTIS